MRPYAIGLDIGITSVGWAALALDADENPCGIIGLGSRITCCPKKGGTQRKKTPAPPSAQKRAYQELDARGATDISRRAGGPFRRPT